MSDIFVAMAA